MKKAIILFLIFLAIDLVAFIVLTNVNNGHDFNYYFLPLLFLEVAVYGSFIIYEISKLGNKKDK